MINHAQFWGGGGAAPYEIEQSLRFNQADGHYLNRTPSTDGNRRTFTYSGWHKFLGMPDASNNRRIFGARSANTDSGWFSFHMRPDGDNRLEIQLWNHSVIVDNRLRDFSAWYHLVLAVDTTQATATDRVKVYINGTQATYTNNSGSGISGFSQNLDLAVNDDAADHNIGTFESSTASTSIMPMYAAEINFVDGTALDQYDFGEFDDNNVWRPIRYTGSHGTNGFYLNFSNSSDLGEDQAGSNDWTGSTRFTTSGTGTDVMDDTPTNNFCTLNPLFQASNLTNGNLEYNRVSPNIPDVGTIALPANQGKWYWEIVFETTTGDQSAYVFGVVKTTLPRGTVAGSYSAYQHASDARRAYGILDSGPSWSWSVGDVLGIGIDMTNGDFRLYKNGTLISNWTGAVDTNYAHYPFINGYYSGDKVTMNFGQRAFEQTPPTGHVALCTANLPAPDIADGSDYFNTVLYTGNDGTQSVSGIGFQPDLVWIKNRSNTASHWLNDAVRGAGLSLASDTAEEEKSYSAYFTAFGSDGFSLAGGTPGFNDLNNTYASWNWLAGGSGSSNTAGSIPSTVSANPTAGFSIVSYTGTGTAGATVGHGLGVPPSMIIIKNRDDSASSFWCVYHKSAYVSGSDPNVLYLNSSQAQADDTNVWGGSPDFNSTTFELGDYNGSNGTGDDLIAYCFAEVEGYSKFGSYTGNGSSDGPFVYCGFRPAWVMIKATAGSGNSWYISDNQRNAYNVVDNRLLANDPRGQSTSVSICDFTANGFKIRTNDSGWNTSSSTYIFATFSENPFGGSGVSPATAR